METVKYRNKTYVVSRPVDKEEDGLFTVHKQDLAREMFNKGMSSSEISQILNVDETLLQIWYAEIAKSENISKAVMSYNAGRSKKVICTDTNTGEEVEYVSLSACGRALNILASTVRNKILQGKKYKNYSFRYAED